MRRNVTSTHSSARGIGASGPSGQPSRSFQSRLRCAVYTRKSTEEGLDQEFNSLDAQREACAAFIASQVGLGWQLVADRYDDGGISGGTMERPALQRLLQDIRDRKVDVVVVYKIDRLTRSLADFAKIVEVFDGHSVSFVSVTQQFNTTTSMGRLTLNVLLSFAQFEREVTAERIRDKIAASRKKGMWMGGRVPLGYRVQDRRLLVDPETAFIVQHMFARLLNLGSVGELLAELRRQYPSGIRVRSPDDDAAGLTASPSPNDPAAFKPKLVLMRGPLTYLLTNPVYIGKVKHHDALHDGEHEPIVDPELFDRVQQQLKRKAPRRAGSTNAKDVHLLTDLLFDEIGDRFAPTSSSSHGRRYRYYVSSRLRAEGSKSGHGWRLPAGEIEGVVIRQVGQVLRDHHLLSAWIGEYAPHANVVDGLQRAEALATDVTSALPFKKQGLLKAIVQRVLVAPTKLTFEIDPIAVVDLILGVADGYRAAGLPSDEINVDEPEDQRDRLTYRFERSARFTRRGYGKRIVVEGAGARDADDELINLVARSHYLLVRLTDGSCSSIKQLATESGLHSADISRILPLAFLSPSILQRILAGTQASDLTPAHLRRSVHLPADWSQQLLILSASR